MQFTFIGCSFTVGEGLPLEKKDPSNYVNILTRHYQATTINLSEGGNNNQNIFMVALNEIVFNAPDKIFVQWSGVNRLLLRPGPDTVLKILQTIKNDYKYRDIVIPKKDLQKFANIYHLLNHDYNNLMTIINYSKLLTEISKNKTQLIFINGLIPWTEDILNMETLSDMSGKLSDYYKKVLEFDSRNDNELIRFFTNLNLAFSELDQSLWVNMFSSMVKLQVDYGTDDLHPGIKSHKLYADMIIKYLEDKND